MIAVATGLELPFPAWGLVAVSGLLMVVGREMSLARIRTALNRELHEIRRPLQALSLESPGGSVLQAVRAVGRLDRTLNGGRTKAPVVEDISCRLMIDACVRRWRSRAHLAGAELELRWTGADVLVRGEAEALCGAIENLILNAIEHGGPKIRIQGLTLGHWVRIEVIDSGPASRAKGREASPAEMIARQRGQGSHGHGLNIARQTIVDHGGRLELELGRDGSIAAVALPCSRGIRAGGCVRVNC